jgi:NADH:ubiquinone reductase (H+-translocating)
MTTNQQKNASRHELVIVGGGVAGLDIATHLSGKESGGKPLHVTLIDKEPAYVWKPMLHTIAAGTSDAGAQQTPFAAQARSHGFAYQLGEATAIDRAKKEVRVAPLCRGDLEVVPARTIRYDTLLLAIGSRANDFGTPGVAAHCAHIDSRSEAIAFNDELRIRLLKAVASNLLLSIGIVGGGATGVELAAELIRLAAVAEDYGAHDASSHIKVYLIESGPRLLGPFPERVSKASHAKLEELGVVVRTGARVASVDEAAFVLADGERIAADLKVWAAGVKAPPLLDHMGDVQRSHTGQLMVGPTLASIDDPAIYAVGDCASPRLSGRDSPVPTTAQAAHQQALYLCKHLPALIAGQSAPEATYHDFGSLVSLGGFDAYGSLGRFGFFDGGFIRGRVAQLGHAMLYRNYQARLHGPFRGSLLWLADTLARRVKPAARLA